MTKDALGSAEMASHQVWERKADQKRSACATSGVMKQTEYGGREEGSACGELFEESKQSNWRDWTAFVGGRDKSSHERTQLRTSDEV